MCIRDSFQGKRSESEDEPEALGFLMGPNVSEADVWAPCVATWRQDVRCLAGPPLDSRARALGTLYRER
eukprot:1755877-Pyramimonas_sp.AAC.1